MLELQINLDVTHKSLLRASTHMHRYSASSHPFPTPHHDVTDEMVPTPPLELKVVTELSTHLDVDDVSYEPEPFSHCSCGAMHRGTYRGQNATVLRIAQSTDPEQLRRDVDLCDSLRSNYILILTGAVYVPEDLMLVAEATQLGTLHDVRPHVDFTLAMQLKCALDCALALWAVHGSNHAYLHLRPQNVVVCCFFFSLSLSSRPCVHPHTCCSCVCDSHSLPPSDVLHTHGRPRDVQAHPLHRVA